LVKKCEENGSVLDNLKSVVEYKQTIKIDETMWSIWFKKAQRSKFLVPQQLGISTGTTHKILKTGFKDDFLQGTDFTWPHTANTVLDIFHD
jgi:hypothetical protein